MVKSRSLGCASRKDSNVLELEQKCGQLPWKEEGKLWLVQKLKYFRGNVRPVTVCECDTENRIIGVVKLITQSMSLGVGWCGPMELHPQILSNLPSTADR